MTAVGMKALWHLVFEPSTLGVEHGGTLLLSGGCCLWPVSLHGLLPSCSPIFSASPLSSSIALTWLLLPGALCC